MFNEAERSNVAAVVLKFIAFGLMILGAASILSHFFHGLNVELSKFADRMVSLL